MIVYRDLKTVERELGFSAKTLYGLSNSIPSHYRKVYIPKRNGSQRMLSVPDEVLKKVQRAIADKLLAYEPVSKYATAYRVASGVKKNASVHTDKEKILKLDIYKFFDSITYSRVKDAVFPESKYSEPIRILLAMLCYYKEVLPQGAPTSPAITNIIMREFDETVGAYCRQKGIAYTRYCDDMTFSGSFDEKEITGFVKQELKKLGLILNKRKTAVITACRRQTVTGIVVNEKLNISAEYKRKIRSEVYYCTRYGVESHLRHIDKSIAPADYLRSLLGRISFVLQICPKDKAFMDYKETVATMLKKYE